MKTIFIVDDNDSNLFAAQSALESHYDVYTMPSAIAMFRLIEKVTPDLILMDIKMPEMNGFDAVKKLKTDSRYDAVPVIFLTGQTDDYLEVQGMALGAVDFIQKPFSVPMLQRNVKMHLDIEELIQERTKQLHEQIETLQRQVSMLQGAPEKQCC